VYIYTGTVLIALGSPKRHEAFQANDEREERAHSRFWGSQGAKPPARFSNRTGVR
jgi:hypothetical protein